MLFGEKVEESIALLFLNLSMLFSDCSGLRNSLTFSSVDSDFLFRPLMRARFKHSVCAASIPLVCRELGRIGGWQAKLSPPPPEKSQGCVGLRVFKAAPSSFIFQVDYISAESDMNEGTRLFFMICNDFCWKFCLFHQTVYCFWK